jgi:hypothetical protein
MPPQPRNSLTTGFTKRQIEKVIVTKPKQSANRKLMLLQKKKPMCLQKKKSMCLPEKETLLQEAEKQ